MTHRPAASAPVPGAAMDRLLRAGKLLAMLPAAASFCLWCGAAPAAAESVRDVIINQNSVLERYTPPPTRPRGIGVTVVTDEVVGVAPEALDSVRFTLGSVQIEGAVTLDPALFAPLYAPLVGRTITLRELDGVLKGIEAIYRDNDYYARAFAPQQDLGDGTVRIVVYESYIREVSIEGDVHNIRNLEGRLRPFIDKMVEMRPVRISKLLRYALLMSDLAGLTIDAEFSQIPDEPGAGRLVLRLDFDPSTFRARLDNLASDDIGPLALAGAARFNNLFGMFESTDLLIVTNPAAPEELVLGKLAQHFPLGPSGFAFGYDVAHIWSQPQDEQDIRAETTQAGTYLNYALLRSQERNVIASLGLRGQDTTVDVDGQRAVDQRKRWLKFGATYDDTILGFASIVEGSFGQGIDAFNASGEDNNDFRFASVEGSLSRGITDTINARFQYSGQYAFTDLPSPVRYSLGGESFGRAFDSGAIAGQSGYALAFEMGKDLDLDIDWLTGFTVFGFVDYGAVWNPPDTGGYEFASLGSAGGGVRARVGSHTSLAAWVAVPYKDEPALGVEGTRVSFTAGVQF
jgi:hemolysin activation/secretion protein